MRFFLSKKKRNAPRTMNARLQALLDEIHNEQRDATIVIGAIEE